MNKKLTAMVLSAALISGTFAMSNGQAYAAGKVWKQNINSIMHRGWVIQDSKWRYYNNDGQKSIGWLLYNGKWFYLNTDGDMQTGWLKHNNKWYYMNQSGDMAESSWVLWNNKWYYLNNDGEMAINIITPDGYKVGSDGAWVGDEDVEVPDNVKAEAVSSSEIRLQWDEIEDADCYYVYYSFSEDKGFKPVMDGGYTKKKFQWHSDFSAAVTGLASNTKVYFKVTAVVDNSESNYSDTVSATTNEAVDVPEDVDAKAISSDSIKVTWDEVDDADYYKVYYKESGDDEFTSVKKTSNSFTLDDLDPDTKVYFKVSAVVDGTESKCSDTVYATTNEVDVDVPENVEAEAASSDSINVSWDEVDDADYYIVYYKASSDSSYDSEEAYHNSITFNNLDSDTKYYFKVTAVVDGDKSDYSDTVYAKTDSE